MDQSQKTETEALSKIITDSMQPVFETTPMVNCIEHKGEVPYAVVPKGMEIKSLQPLVNEFLSKPKFREGTVKLDRLGSFCAIVNRFKCEDTALFAKGKILDNDIEASLLAVFDYYPEGKENTLTGRCQHKALYNFPISKEFSFWLSNNSKVLSQGEFAELLEDRINDLVVAVTDEATTFVALNPKFADPIEILELSRDLEIYSNEQCKQKVKLASGETELKFTSEHVDGSGKPITIPDFFMINIPIFEMGDYQSIPVRLRYRLSQGSVKWFFELYRIDQVFDEAFHEACDEAVSTTELPLFIGSPESR